MYECQLLAVVEVTDYTDSCSFSKVFIVYLYFSSISKASLSGVSLKMSVVLGFKLYIHTYIIDDQSYLDTSLVI